MAVEVVSYPREGKTKYVPGWKLQFFYNLIPEVTPYRFCLNHTVKSKSLGAAHTQAEEFYTKVWRPWGTGIIAVLEVTYHKQQTRKFLWHFASLNLY